MSNRSDPKSGPGATKRARQMTVYDRLEDARARRHALMAERETLAKKPAAPPAEASNTPTPPKPKPSPISEPEVVAETLEPTPGPPPPVMKRRSPEPINLHMPRKSRKSGYFTRLFQAMAVIALIAALIGFSAQLNLGTDATVVALQEEALAPANVTATPIPLEPTAPDQPPEPVIAAVAPATPLDTPAPTPAPAQSHIDVQTAAEPLLAAPDAPTFNVSLAAVDTPPAKLIKASLIPSSSADLPPALTGVVPPLQRLVPPTFIWRKPPMRPVSEVPAAPEPPIGAAFADRTTVVLMVPAFAPQSSAEDLVASAAALGIPVDRTLRAPVSISSTNIRYFHAEDAEPATLLAASLGGTARDFTNFTPPPNQGVIEIWMEGRGGNTAPETQGSATLRGVEADLEALRDSIARALQIATGN